ncbi:unnamed protein product [Adineta ricciae]|uniref:Uncharacterized protein n=1 Tax=Adineta ricciae TaxID=249248 RepID=A0A814IPG6_ADIRI|nr:unnamed protein product [Adineta ricciae]
MYDFYTIETPPSSSSTSKDSLDEYFSLYQMKTHVQFVSANREQISQDTMKIDRQNMCHPICNDVRREKKLITNKYSSATSDMPISVVSPQQALKIKIDHKYTIITKNTSCLYRFPFQCCPRVYEDMDTSLRHNLGNTKLKTRQDVRRFRKFLKRNHNLSSISLVDIDPDTMRTYLIDYLTSIRTRKGLKYDPETLRSYYLSIQRYLKDCNYPYCLRNSPQFTQCRDLIIRMRKEKNQNKSNEFSSYPTRYSPTNDLSQQHSSAQDCLPNLSNTCIDLLPLSSLPPRKRQKMKYFLESNSSCDIFIYTPIPRTPSPPLAILSSDAYLILIKFISSSQTSTPHFEQLLDQSPACGMKQRLMLTTLCHHWVGDIRIIHGNLRPELSSFLPHILLMNILSKRS